MGGFFAILRTAKSSGITETEEVILEEPIQKFRGVSGVGGCGLCHSEENHLIHVY